MYPFTQWTFTVDANKSTFITNNHSVPNVPNGVADIGGLR